MRKVFSFFIIFFKIWFLQAQTLPVGLSFSEDFNRRSQLMGNVDPSLSFTIRPLSLDASKLNLKNLLSYTDTLSSPKRPILDSVSFKKITFKLLPIDWQQQYNTTNPYGWNDGAMIPAKGYQTMFSAGFFAKYGLLSIQLRPEAVFAENKYFEDHPELHATDGRIDQPIRFGNKPYSKLFWGQSSIRLTYKALSLGISNENLWWGPGIRSSLLMSNTAPGFKHVTLNTVRPINTFLGSFEGQLISGRLDGSDIISMPDDWRYISGIVFTYQPKWTPGLFLGITRAFQMYHKDMDGSIGDYIPLFTPFEKARTNEAAIRRDQLASVFMRWLWVKSKAEIYIEFGRNDHSEELRDFLMEPDHSSAYLLGFMKMIPLSNADKSIQVAFELTQMEQTSVRVVRDAGAWYYHGEVAHGYTNLGQVLGAGVSSGGNLQSLSVNWCNGLKKLGLQFERYTHNNDLYYVTFYDSYGNKRKWTDISTTANANWDYKNMLINAKLQVIHSSNYAYQLDKNTLNVQLQLGLTYRFN